MSMPFRVLILAASNWMLLTCDTLAADPLDKPTSRKEPSYDGKPLSAWLIILKAGNNEDRNKAADALAQMAQEMTATIAAIRDIGFNPKTLNLEAMLLLPRFGGAAVPALTQTVWDEDPQVRRVGANLLGRIGWEARFATPTLIRALKDPEPVVRAQAAESLGQIEAYSAISDLLILCEDADAHVRISAANALISLGAAARPALTVLLRELDRVDDTLAIQAAQSLARLGPEAGPTVADIMKILPNVPVVRHHALLRVLQEIGPEAKSTVPALKRFAHNHPVARASVAMAIWSIARDEDAPAMLRAYLKDATDDTGSHRGEAAMALWKIQPGPAGVSALANLANDASTALGSIEYLGRIGAGAKDAVAVLADRLSDDKSMIRQNAAQALGRIGPGAKKALPALAKTQTDDDIGVRVIGLASACKIMADETAVVALANTLKQKQYSEWKAYAARELGMLGKAGRPALAVLKAASTDPDEMLRMEAAIALWRIDRDPAAQLTLITLLQSRNAEVRGQIPLVISLEFGDSAETAVPIFTKMLFDIDVYVRRTAAEELGRIGPKSTRALPALVAALSSDGDTGLISATCEALGRIGAPAKTAIPQLKRQLGHPAKIVRVHASLALWLIAADDTGAKELNEALGDRSYRVRITSADALWQMTKGDRVMPLLLRSLRDTNLFDDPDRNNEAFMAIRALGRIGPRAKEAVPDLIGRLTHYQNDLATAAADALRRIEPETAKRLLGPPP